MGRWFRRLGVAAGTGIGATAVFDVTNDEVLSRGIRALYNGARIAAAYKTSDLKTLEDISNLHADAADRIVSTCLRNEGLFIKFGQGLSSMNHVLPPEYTSRLEVLLDAAPRIPLQEALRTIEEDLGRPASEFFESFDETPVAAASIAQVHRATLRRPDGTVQPVAVKVLKPKIRKQMWWDITVHRILCAAVEWGFDLKISWSAQTIHESLLREVDFTVEADYTEKGRKFLAGGRSDVYVPKVYSDVSTSRVLVSEWIDAVKLVDREKVKAQFDSAAAMKSLMEAWAHALFRHGFVHADPHPANVMVRRHNGKQQVVLLDFGLCVETSDAFRHQYARLWRAIFSHDFAELEEVVQGWGIGDADLFASLSLQKPFSRSRPVHSTEVTPQDLVEFQRKAKERMNKLLEDEERIPRELVFVGRGAQLLRSVNKGYGAPVNRANLFAQEAVAALGEGRMSLAYARFTTTLWLLAVAHWWTTTVNNMLAYFTTTTVRSLEDIMEDQEKDLLAVHHRPNIAAND